ncbi:MAG: prohibitin family protein [Clostridia bacterium]|nr:prohibitin family protein [Clostridia bacterium]
MSIRYILVLVFALLIVGAAFALRATLRAGKKPVLPAVFLVLLVLGFVLIPFSFHMVDTGEVAVVKHLGEARAVRTAGAHFDFWLTEEYQVYDAKVQNVDIATVAYSSDAQTMDIQMTLQYQIMSDKVIDIAKQYGDLSLLQNRIQSVAIEKTKAVLSSNKAMDIIANRASMSPAVEKSIKDAIDDDYFVIVNTVVITNIDFSDAFESAVEEKMIAEQKLLQAEYENQTKIKSAEAAAKAKLTAAEAEAEANKLIEESLTENILREKYLDKWNGQLPNVVAGESTSLMIPTYGTTE